MKCTSCGNGTLNSSYLEPQLPCYQCSNCSGNFLMISDFLRWKETNDIVQPQDSNCTIEAEETSKAMICPKTGTLMTKYKISKDTDHRLDLSPSIDAVWIDKGEWELLKEEGLANNISAIFTDHWQRKVRDEETADIFSSLYQRKFGGYYSQLQAFRKTLDTMDNRSEALAYLMAEDPYKV